MHREQALFYKQPGIEQAKRALYEVEDKFMEFMMEFRAKMIRPESTIKHAKKWTDEAGWIHTYCGQYTHPAAAEGLVLNYSPFLTTKYKCARCTIKLEEEHQAGG